MTTDDVDSSTDYGERWAAVYDDEYSYMVPPDSQLALLADLAGDRRTLELGIGTGRIALPLAARGVSIEGLDASTSMVKRLRAKAGGADLPVTIGDMADVPVAGPFGLVYLVFNSFFGLLTQQRQVACFRGVAAVLEPGGAFLLECFVPDLGRFDRGQSLRTIRLADDDARLDASVHDPVGQRVTSSVIRVSNTDVSVRPIRLRYAWPAEIDLMAQLAGLRLRDRWGGWNRERFTASSGQHVSVYEPAPLP